MFRVIVLGLLFALSLVACSSQSSQNFIHNLSAADCANPAATVQGITAPMPITFNQALAIQGLTQLCTGLYGPVAAPTPAPGNQPAFPAVH